LFPAWDVFVNCAAFFSPTPTTIQGGDEDDWWKAFETTVRSVQHFTKSFMPKARADATYISISSSTALLPTTSAPKVSAYAAAKLAAAKLDEYLSTENPRMRTFTLDPGLIKTGLFEQWKQDLNLPNDIKIDDISLPADTCVWLASGESEFLRGRYILASYDVDELLERKAEFEANPSLLRITLGGTHDLR
jgi:NAD(P)-dependent dehydrogenase (short-subunit alcohol dehydrogenase family)